MSGLATAGRVGAVWLDGRLVSPAEANLPLLSMGLHNALSVFEGIRAYGGRAFAAQAHAERLYSSARSIGMTLPWDTDQVVNAIEDALAAAGFDEAYIRPVAWRGDETIGIDPADTTVHLAVAVLRWPEQQQQRQPVRLGLSAWARPAPGMAPVGAKCSANYLVGSLALTEAKRAGFDDALLLDHKGRVAEATGANIFVVRAGEVITPVADTFLNGITRRTVLTLAEQTGIPARITRLSLEDVHTADEVFLTGTAVGIMPVGSFLDTEYRDSRPLTRTMAAAYTRHVTKESPRVPSA